MKGLTFVGFHRQCEVMVKDSVLNPDSLSSDPSHTDTISVTSIESFKPPLLSFRIGKMGEW